MKTYRECCLDIFQEEGVTLTCAQTIKKLPIERLTGDARYMTATISSILRKLIKKGFLEYADAEIKGPRGGHTYRKRRV